MTIDREKVARVKKILGTTTLAETVDAALEDVKSSRGVVGRRCSLD